jgi:hypothetical protein
MKLKEHPTNVYVERLDDRILVVAEPQGAIALSPVSAVRIARGLLSQGTEMLGVHIGASSEEQK